MKGLLLLALLFCVGCSSSTTTVDDKQVYQGELFAVMPGAKVYYYQSGISHHYVTVGDNGGVSLVIR